MKKILSIALVVVMLFACVPFSANAADYGYGWQWDDSVAYGYIQNIKCSASDVVMEFDVSVVQGAEGALFEMWTGSGGNMGINALQGTAYIGTQAVAPIAWGELSGTNWHHVKYTINNGAGSIAIDGTVVVSGTGVTNFAADSIVFFANNGIVTIANLAITDNAGNEIFATDFSDPTVADKYFPNSLGGIVELVSKPTPPDPDDPDPTPDPEPDPDPIVPPVTGEANKVMRIDGYAAIAKEIKKCDDYPVYNYGTVEFDLYMLPGSAGTAKFELFESYEGSVRPTITNNAYGYSYTWTEYEELHGFSWGSLSLDNMRHFKMEHDDEQIKLYMDDQFLTSIPYGTTPAMPGLVFYVSQGFILIDNLVFTDSEGGVHGNYDFDTTAPRDNEGDWSIVTLGDCATYGHVAGVVDILKLSPTCTEQGYQVRYCVACGLEASRTYIPALGHAYGAYAAAKVETAATAEEDGVLAWTCGRCGLDAAKGVQVATGDYKGNIVSFDDFSDWEVTQYITGGFPAAGNEEPYAGEYVEIEDGNAVLRASTNATYHQFNSEIDTKGFTVSYDFRFNELMETTDSENYGHNMHFWFGGSSIINNWAGYDFENQEFFIKANSGEPYAPIYAPYEIEAGKWYNLTFKYYSNTDTFEAWCAIYINGEQVIIFDDIDAAYELPYDASRATAPVLFRIFGADISFDNYVIGDADFEWINFRTPENEEIIVTPGDLSGDGLVNAQDSMLIKKILIGAISLEDVNALNADANGDGVVNAKDSRAIKEIILG